jgi:DNA-binding winged helix-turn-helix (wHTH) protein/TolB-like protein
MLLKRGRAARSVLFSDMADTDFLFADFQFDAATGDLTGPSGTTRLGPQPSRLLSMLLARPGELVTRAELKSALWPDTVVEADVGLNSCVRQIRAALGDEADQGRFIETLPRRGYRFVAPLKVASSAAEVVSAPVVRSRLPLYVAGALVAALAVAIFVAALNGRPRSTNVGVIPLVAQPGDPAWVTDLAPRLTERLVVQLTAKSPDAMGVVGPVTTGRFVADQRPHTELAREIGVGYMMSGVIRASDSTVFVQVVRASDGVHVFAFRRRVVGVDLDSLSTAIVTGAAAKMLAR